MVDCGNPRCLQEKRYFRKELQLWSKKVPYALGLELVAEHLAGSSSGHIKTLLLPFNDMESEKVTDFGEENSDGSTSKCIYCNGEPLSELEDIPPDITHSMMSNSNVMSTHHPACDPVSLLQLPGTSTDLDGLTGFYNQLAMTSFLYQQQQQLQQQGASAMSLSALHEASRAFQEENSTREIPLDLTASQHQQKYNDLEIGELRVPEIKLKKKKDGVRRAYTDEELKAAVEAIQSGTIGTRRAAQIYGVPRSTLRNKVFKASENDKHGTDGSQLVNGGPSHSAAESDRAGSTSPLSKVRSRSASPPATSLSASNQQIKEDEVSSQAAMAQQSAAFLRQLEDMRAKQNFNPMTLARSFGDMFNPMYFGYPFFMPPQFTALMGGTVPSGFDYTNPYAASMMMPYLPDLVKNLSQKRLDTAKHLQQSICGKLHKNGNVNISHEDDDLKIPTYKSVNGEATQRSVSPRTNKALHHTSSTLRTKHSSLSPSEYLHNLVSPPSAEKRSLYDSSNFSPSKRLRISEVHNSSSASSAVTPQSGSSTGKKRPKRGQYRKYDSELLAQAVKAVQRGEMSVHRAGTFFGVPHSTLEYKVKERHLLRKKKLAENAENKVAASCNEAMLSTSSNNSVDSNLVEKLPQTTADSDDKDDRSNASSPTAKSLAKPFSSVSPNQPTNTGFSFEYGLPFSGLNTPASELLKKLHARAHEKANEILNNASATSDSPENGSSSCVVSN